MAGRKIAILGKAPDSLVGAPVNDESWEIWTINDSVYRGQVTRWTRHFELHPIEWTKEAAYDKYFDWLCEKHDQPIVLREAVEAVVSGIAYPRAEVIGHFAGPGADYFTNTISWMLALAIWELDVAGDKEGEIGLWGVNMAQHGIGGKSEYAKQRPSCEFWAGMARGRGYTFHLPDASDLLKTGVLYGFDQGGMLWTKMRERDKELQGRIDTAAQMKERCGQEELFLRGALECNHYWKQWINDTREEPAK